MLDLNSLFEFSRGHCIGICAFLVPANLLATLQVLIFVGLRRSPLELRLITTAATVYSVTMVLHVATWWMVGVVRIPTFVLLSLATLCLGLTVWAIARPDRLRQLIVRLSLYAKTVFVKRFNLSSAA